MPYIVFGAITTVTLFCQLERLNPELQLAAPGARLGGGWEDDQ